MNSVELRKLTEDYWAKGDVDGGYVAGLLPHELEYAKRQGGLPAASDEKTLLVLLVGHSVDPLLQSICAHRPSEYLLVLNTEYDTDGSAVAGAVWGDKIQTTVDSLSTVKELDYPGLRGLRRRPSVPLTRDTPESVFRHLLGDVLPRAKGGLRVVVDITGGKKSMVAGAYLFAAYAGVEVSYVDFDEYSPRHGRPYGYLCRIGILRDLYQDFGLRRWQDIRRHYERYSFAAAGETAREVVRVMKAQSPQEAPLFSEDEVGAVELLESWFGVYGRWMSGDLRGSYLLAQALKGISPTLDPPKVVSVLGEGWPSPADSADASALLASVMELEQGVDGTTGMSSLYSRPKDLLLYAQDELHKIELLVEKRKDFRSALLRSAGLSEMLLKARLIALWDGESLVLRSENDRSGTGGLRRGDMEDCLQRKIVRKLIGFAGVPAIVEVLSADDHEGRATSQLLLDGLSGLKFPGLRAPTKRCRVFRTGEPWAMDSLGDDLRTEDLSRLRNKAIHFCLSPSEELAKQAVQLVRRSFDEYRDGWVDETDIDALDLPSWEELCQVCGIDFLPHLSSDGAVS